MTERTGWDTIADLQDAPDKLRAIADMLDHPATTDPSGHAIYVEGSDLRRHADAIQEFLDGTSGSHWKAYAYLGGCAAVGFLAGVVTMMVLTR